LRRCYGYLLLVVSVGLVSKAVAMPFVGADIIKGYIRQYRVLNVTGGYGTGKTAVSFAFAYDLMNTGEARYLLSNTANVWDEGFHYNLSAGKTLDTITLLDEGGLFLETWADAKQYLFALRKINVFVIIPSVTPTVTPISTRVSFLRVWRRFNGLPFWLMNYRLRVEGEIEQGKFIWLFPQEIYGVYDTSATPVDDMGIGAWLNAHVQCAVWEYYEREQKQRQNFIEMAKAAWGLSGKHVQKLVKLSPMAQDNGGGQMMEAASIMQEALEMM
jgi:hypothetical protein